MNPLELTGRAITHLVLDPTLKLALHPAVVPAFNALQESARAAGHDLQVVSAFRSFDRQVAIWNGKWRGERPLLDADEKPLDAMRFTPEEKVRLILLWSALPGTSRHHWGTDLDIIDRAALPSDRKVELLQRDFRPGGCFQGLDEWLEAKTAQFDFYRPYQGQGSTQAEPWHLSFRPMAQKAESFLTAQHVREALKDSPLEGLSYVLDYLDSWPERSPSALREKSCAKSL